MMPPLIPGPNRGSGFLRAIFAPSPFVGHQREATHVLSILRCRSTIIHQQVK